MSTSRRTDVPRELPTAARLRSPLLLAFAALLAFEAASGVVIFFARLAYGSTPGETLHIVAGVVLTGFYAAYQWRHWQRVRPVRRTLDYGLGLLATSSIALTQLTGFALAVTWWQSGEGAADYPPLVSALHSIGNMLVLTFVAAHIGAVLQRAGRERGGSRA